MISVDPTGNIPKLTRSWGIFVPLLILLSGLLTCSTKNLIGTEKVGSIFVTSNVEGADITLDDNQTGKQTADTLRNVSVGRHTISVSKQGYNSNPESDTVDVVENGLATVSFFLTNKVGRVFVDSDPQGAGIMLDHGSTQKSTPDTLDSVAVGTHVISVEKEGYRPSPELDTVDVVEDSLITVDFALTERLGDVFVNSNIGGADIILDHVPTGKTTPDTVFDLMVGNHVVSVAKSGYSAFPDSAVVEVLESSVVTVNFVLAQNTGGLFVNSTPQGAEIYLNHENSGEVTPNLFSLPEGDYVVWVEKSGYSAFPESAAVTVVKDDLVDVDFTLTPKKGSIFVDSDPEGASILLDHAYTGRITPGTILDVLVGDHIVSVTKGGYLASPESLVVNVLEDQVSTAEFVLLDTLYGSLKVSSNVDGATICTDNQPTAEVTPRVFFNSIPVGTHIISVFRAGYANEEPTKEIVNIATGDTAEVSFNLSPTEVGKDSGDITLDFYLEDDYGLWHRLYAYRGFVIIINFWAESCVNCMIELPYLQEIYVDYASDTLIIFGLNYEDGFDVIRRIREEEGLTFTLLKDTGGGVKNDYGITGTPVTIILDRGGKIYFYWQGFQHPSVAQKFRDALDELFGR